MNCTQARNDLLLRDSGELNASARKELEGHLASCPRCCAFQTDTVSLLERAAGSLPVLEPGEAALNAVRTRARACAGKSRKQTLVLRVWPRIIAAAAAVMLLFGWQMRQRHQADTDAWHRIQSVMLLIEDPVMPLDDLPRAKPANQQAALRRLGEELLWSQGLMDFEDDVFLLNGG